jgi:alkylation response protein AidB-like acyl-CoA dehydrogenase
MAKLPQERIAIAVNAVAQAEAAFGQPIGSFQHNRFALAELRTELDIAQVYVDRQVDALNAGELSAEDAAKAKWWTTELQWRVLDTGLQLHGGSEIVRRSGRANSTGRTGASAYLHPVPALS